MNEFDDKLRTALSEEDRKYIEENFDDSGYYNDILSSLKGPDATINRMVWFAVFVMSGLLLYCLYGAFQASTTRAQILFAAVAVMANSAQIAFQLWANMRVNRRAVLVEIQKLRLEMAQ